MKNKTTTTIKTKGFIGGTTAWVKGRFNFYSPKKELLPQFKAVETGAENFAAVLVENIPEGEERTIALKKLGEVVNTGNYGIAASHALSQGI